MADAFRVFRRELETLANNGESFVVRLRLHPDHHVVVLVRQPELIDEEFPESATMVVYQAQAGMFSIAEREPFVAGIGCSDYRLFMSNMETVFRLQSLAFDDEGLNLDALDRASLACFGLKHEAVE